MIQTFGFFLGRQSDGFAMGYQTGSTMLFGKIPCEGITLSTWEKT